MSHPNLAVREYIERKLSIELYCVHCMCVGQQMREYNFQTLVPKISTKLPALYCKRASGEADGNEPFAVNSH